MTKITRRRFVTGAVAGTAFLGGCSGSSEDSTPTLDPTPSTTSEPSPDPEVEARLEDAYESLGSAADRFLGEVEKLDQTLDYVDFETGQGLAYLDSAADQLDAAGRGASGEQTQVVESLGVVVDWLRSSLNALSVYDEAVDQIETGQTYASNERYEDALERYGSARDLYDEAGSHVADALTAIEEFDVEPLDDVDESDLVEGREATEQLDEAVEGMAEYTQVGVEFVTALLDFITGTQACSDERFADAIDSLEAAQEGFDTAHGTARQGEEVAPSWLFEDMLELTCVAGAYRDASEHYMASAEAAEDQDADTFEAEREAATQALNRCN